MNSRIRRWKRRLKVISRDIVGLAHQRRLFREIAELFRTNPDLQTGDGIVWMWLAENYATTAAVAVRRLADPGGGKPVVSLYRLLTEIAANPEALTREWFVRKYVRGRPALTREHYRETGEHDFDAFAGRGAKRVSSKKVLSDRRKLRRAEARVRHFVNKRVAHRALKGYKGPATFADLDAVIDELGRLLVKYSLLLNQAAMGSVEPVIQADYDAPLRVPWKK